MINERCGIREVLLRMCLSVFIKERQHVRDVAYVMCGALGPSKDSTRMVEGVAKIK